MECFLSSFHLIFLRLILNYVYTCISVWSCVHVNAEPSEARRGQEIPRNWSYRWLYTILPCRCWEPNTVLCKSSKGSLTAEWLRQPLHLIGAYQMARLAGHQGSHDLPVPASEHWDHRHSFYMFSCLNSKYFMYWRAPQFLLWVAVKGEEQVSKINPDFWKSFKKAFIL